PSPVIYTLSLRDALPIFIVYFLYVIVIVVNIALFRSRWGLRVRAVGEHPEAADTAGINVNSVRFRNVLIGGAVAGFGGAYFTLGDRKSTRLNSSHVKTSY